jgi:hypothetical protein
VIAAFAIGRVRTKLLVAEVIAPEGPVDEISK